MKNIFRFLTFAFVLGCVFSCGLLVVGCNEALAANIDFTADTELVLTGSPPATVYIASSSAADSVTVAGAAVNANVPSGSAFTLKTTAQTKLAVTPSGGSVNLYFSTAYFSTGYVTQWTASSTTANATAVFSVGAPAGNTYYKIGVNNTHLDYYVSSGAGVVSFTYSGGFSDKVFTIVQDSPPSSGGGGGAACNAPVAPTGGFGLIINSGDLETTSRNVVLTQRFGSDSLYMRLSNSSDLIVLQESSAVSKNWVLTEGIGLKTVYAQFYNSCGWSSVAVSDTINLVSATTTPTTTPTITPIETPTPTTTPITTPAPPTAPTAPITVPTAPVIIPTLPTIPTVTDIASVLTAAMQQVLYIQANIHSPNALTLLLDVTKHLAQLQSALGQITPSFKLAIPASGFYNKMLILGMRGDEITAFQNFLKSQGADIYPEGKITGYFGSLTRAAVQRFQIKYGIAASGDAGFGVVGPKTRVKINFLLGL